MTGRRLGLVLTAVAAVGALALAGYRWRDERAAALLPVPPTTNVPSAIATHLREHHDAALRDPRSVVAVGGLCRAYHADMYFDHAARCYDAVRGLDPDWQWLYYRALIQAERGGGGTLAADLGAVTNAAAAFGPAWLRRGDAEFKAGNYDQAEQAWRRAATLEDPPPGPATPAHIVEVPLAVHASLGLARIALVRGDVTRAREILEDLAAKAPGFSSVHRLLADSYRADGRDADAARAIARANRLPPYAPYADPMVDALARESRNSTFLMRLASEANLASNAAWSEFLTRRAAEFDPDNPDVIVKLGRILRMLERNEEALQYFERYHRMVPGDFEGLAHIGGTLSVLGRFEDAESYFRRALAGEDDPQTHYNLGLLLVITGRAAEGIREYEKALAQDPMHAEARLNLATALARQGQVDRAGRELMLLVERDPENVVARTNLAVILLQQGRRDAAAAQLHEALRLNPAFTPAAEVLESIANP